MVEVEPGDPFVALEPNVHPDDHILVHHFDVFVPEPDKTGP